MSLISEIINFKKKKIINTFIKHNKKTFPKKKYFKKAKSEILIEFNAFYPSQLSMSYLSNVLAERNKAEITAFFNYSIVAAPLNPTILNKIKWFIGNLFSLATFKIYRSFGVNKIFRPTPSKTHKKNADKNYREIIKTIECKQDVLKICIDGVQLGDLIYDTYLRTLRKPTLDIEDNKFKKMLHDFLCLYFFWKEYFDTHKISAIIGVHSSYSYALPLRAAIKKNIPTYALRGTWSCTKLSKDIMSAFGNFFEYPELYNKLDDELKEKGLLAAKENLELRINGLSGVKTHLSMTEKSAFNKIKMKTLIKPSKNIKILIVPHDFFDAVHNFGETLFADFYEWIEFLGKMSEKTNYDWYIKNRPNYEGKFQLYQQQTSEVIKKFVEKYKKIKLLPNDYSHLQIIEEGIDFAFTCFGSVGVEYPLFNIPVVNATPTNPHCRYNFNLHPKTVDEYKKIIYELKNVKLKINKNEIYEYFFIRHIFTDKRWLVGDVSEMQKYVGGFGGQWTPKFFEYWINKFDMNKHKKILDTLEKFLDSNASMLSIEHTQKNF
jgi:hypothetical protein